MITSLFDHIRAFYKDKRFPYFLLLAVGFLIYFNSFFNFFLWDDELLIVKNGYIKNWANIFKIFCVDIFHWTNSSKFYRPLFSLSLLLDYSVWKLNPLGYHLTNLLLHLANSFLIFYLIKRLTTNTKVSLITAILFLIHPVHTEAVTYISGRADPLAVSFILLSFLFFTQSLTLAKAKKQINYVLALIFFVCALLSKEIALILPIILILYDYLLGPPVKPAASFWKKLYKHLIFLAVALIYMTLRNKFLPFSSEGMIPYGLFSRIINLPVIFAFYIYIIFLPFNLRVERFLPLVEKVNPMFFLSILLLILIFIWAAKIYQRSKIQFFFFLWFFVNILVVANILLPLNAVVAEHWVYLPSIGFFYIVATAIEKFFKRETAFFRYIPSQKFKKTILATIIVTLSLLTISRNFEWKSPVAIFESTLKSSRGQFSIRDIRVRYNLGCAYAQRGLLDQAIEEYKKVLAQRPNLEKVHCSLGLTYLQKRLYGEAENELLEAIAIDPEYLRPYYILGILYTNQQEWDKAGAIWDKALGINPNFAEDRLLLDKIALLKDKAEVKRPHSAKE